MASVVYLVKDLLFTSKIREAASHLGVEVTSARDAAALVTAAREARLVLIDLRAVWYSRKRVEHPIFLHEACVGSPAVARRPSVVVFTTGQEGLCLGGERSRSPEKERKRKRNHELVLHIQMDLLWCG